MSDQDIDIQIRAKNLTEEAFRKVSEALKLMEEQTSRNANSLKKFASEMQGHAKSLRSVGVGLSTYVTAPLVAVGGLAAKAAIDFETAFAGVRKTVSGTKPELDAMALSIRQMAREVPLSAVELSKVAEMAGQLGVQKTSIVEFTKTIADIATATNLTADQAGASFARIANITRMPQEQFKNLGSAVVALGNYGASTEQEMLDMALRLSGAGATVGMQVPAIMGLANALSSVGLEAEAGGTAFSKVMVDMAGAVSGGGAQLTRFAAVAGMSAQQFAARFKADAGGAIVAFVEGLGRIKDGGGNLLGTLEALGVQEVRLRDALLRSANAAGLVRESVDLGNRSFRENTELTRAAGERYATTATQMKVLWNQVKDLGIELGGALLPIIRDFIGLATPVVGMVGKLVKGFSDLPGPVRMAGVAVLGLAAAAGPLTMFAGGIAGGISKVALLLAKFAPAAVASAQGATVMGTAWAGLSGILASAGGVVASVGGALVAFVSSPITLCIAAVAGLALGIRYLTGSWNFLLVPLKAVWEAIKWVGGVFADVGRIIKNSLVIGIGMAGDAFRELWGYVQPIAAGIGGALLGAFKSITSWLADKLGPALSWVVDKLAWVFGAVKSGVKSAAETTGAIASTYSRKDLPEIAKPKMFEVAKPAAPSAEQAAALMGPGAKAPVTSKAPGLDANGLPSGMPASLSDEQKAAIKARAKALEELAHVNDVLTVTQQKVILQNHELGLSDRESALILGLHESTVKHYIDVVENRRKTEEKLRDELAKIGAESKKKFFEDQQKAMDASTSQMAANVLTRIEYEKKLSEATMTESERRVAAIQDEYRQAIVGLGPRTEATARQYDEAKAAADAYYQHELDLATATSDTIVERMRAAGVSTRSDLALAAAEARRDFEQMRESGVFAAGEIEAAWERWREADAATRGETRTGWIDTLSILADGFQQIAQIAGDSLSGIVRAVGTVVSSVKTGAQSFGLFMKGISQIREGGFSLSSVLGNLGQGIVGMVSTAISAVGALWNALKRPDWKSAASDVKNAFGVGVSQQMAEAITADAKKYGINRTQAAELRLNEIIQEAGGLTSANIARFEAKAVELFGLAQRGGELGERALGELDKSLVAFGKHFTEAGELGDKTFIAMLQRAKAEGTELAGVSDYLRDRWTSALGGISTYLTTFSGASAKVKELDEKLKGTKKGTPEYEALMKERVQAAALAGAGAVKTEAGAAAFAGSLSLGFNQLVRSGASPEEVVKQMEPAIAALRDQLSAAGLAGGEAFDALVAKLGVMKDEVSGPAVSAVNSLGGAMFNIFNAGDMTSDMFLGFAGQIGQTYAALKEQGKGGEQTLALMQPTLQNLWKMQQRFGVEVDAATQAMLDEAEASGIVGEQHMTDSERMLAATERMSLALEGIARAMGVELPEAMERGVNGVIGEMGRIPRDLDIRVKYETSGGYVSGPLDTTAEPWLDGGEGRSVEPEATPHYGTGAYVTKPTYALVAESGPEVVGAPRQIVAALAQALREIGGRPESSKDGGPEVAAAIQDLAGAIASMRPTQIEIVIPAGTATDQEMVEQRIVPALVRAIDNDAYGAARTVVRVLAPRLKPALGLT